MEALVEMIKAASLRADILSMAEHSTAEDMLLKLMRVEMENVEKSKKQKGKKPEHRTPAMLLVFAQSQAREETQAMKLSGRALTLKTIISNEYPPSRLPFDKLRPIRLRDLLVETVHADCYLVVR